MRGGQVDSGIMDPRAPRQLLRGNRAERESESEFWFASRLRRAMRQCVGKRSFSDPGTLASASLPRPGQSGVDACYQSDAQICVPIHIRKRYFYDGGRVTDRATRFEDQRCGDREFVPLTICGVATGRPRETARSGFERTWSRALALVAVLGAALAAAESRASTRRQLSGANAFYPLLARADIAVWLARSPASRFRSSTQRGWRS